MGMLDHFRRNFARDYELLLNTDLSPDIKIGTVGQIRWGKKFHEEGLPDLQELGITNIPVTDLGAPYNHDFEHSGDTDHAFDLKLTGAPATKYFTEAEAGVSLSFGKRWSYMVSAKGLRYQALNVTEGFLAELQALFRARKLKPQMEFVVGVWTANSVSWVLSLDRSSSIAIKANADIVSMADLGVTWTTVSKRGAVHRLEPHGADSGIPIFFKVARLRRNGDIKSRVFAAESVMPAYSGDVGIYEVVCPSEALGTEDD
jgi:hypothetical protein